MWAAAQPFVFTLVGAALLLAAVILPLRHAVRRHGWPRVRPWVLRAWLAAWLLAAVALGASHLNRKFHFALLEAAQKPVLRTTVEAFWVTTGPILKIFHIKTAGIDYQQDLHRHEAVLDALEARDSEAAAKAIQADIAWGGKIMIDWLVKREQEAQEPEVSNARSK